MYTLLTPENALNTLKNKTNMEYREYTRNLALVVTA